MPSGTQNSAGDFLRSVFSALVNKDDEVFKALFANAEETGAIETVFNEIEKTRDEWCNNSDVYNQTGEMLEKTLSYFSVLERLFEESDTSYKYRNALIFYRNGDTLWGDKWDVLNIFKAYFGTNQVFIVNDTNSIEENILLDGDFEEKNAWILEDCNYDPSARFSERIGVYFNSPGICKQTVSLDSGSTYFVHFFLSGNIGVQIKDNNDRYYDAARGEFGEWVSHPAVNDFSTSDWDAKRIFFLTDALVNSVTISFIGKAEEVSLLDYVRLFKKGNWSSFTLVASFSGIYTKDTLAMTPGTDDPAGSENNGINYELMSYIEHANLLGMDTVKQESVYAELLEIVRAGGIASYIEIVTREN
jgi:hypothetical protein